DQALPEDEGIKQNGACAGFLGGPPKAAVELSYIAQARRVDALHRCTSSRIRTRPLADPAVGHHGLRNGAVGMESEERFQPLARALAGELSRFLDRGDAAAPPRFQHGIKQSPSILEASVEAALGDAEVRGQDLHPHALDAAAADLLQPSLDPHLAPA